MQAAANAFQDVRGLDGPGKARYMFPENLLDDLNKAINVTVLGFTGIYRV